MCWFSSDIGWGDIGWGDIVEAQNLAPLQYHLKTTLPHIIPQSLLSTTPTIPPASYLSQRHLYNLLSHTIRWSSLQDFGIE